MKLIDLLGEVISLSKKIRDHLDKNKIKKAKGELGLIINLDLEELRILQSKSGDLRLLIECKNVLHLAKKALMELESLELTSEVKDIIDKIIEIEEHQFLEIKEDEKKLNALYNYWHEHFFNGVFYHGTNSMALDKIKRYGLVPGMVPWDVNEINLLDFLIKKSGYEHGVGPLYNASTIGRYGKSGIFLTVDMQASISSAKRSPEMWSQFVGDQNWSKKDKNHAVKEIYSLLIYRGAANRMMPIPEYNAIVRLYDTDIKKFSIHLRELCPLSNKEINEVIRIFNKYWDFFANAKPILITISSQAPAILKIRPEYGSFTEFASISRTILSESYREFISSLHFLKISDTDLKITERIPAKYITGIVKV